jgi:hypothetical protein
VKAELAFVHRHVDQDEIGDVTERTDHGGEDPSGVSVRCVGERGVPYFFGAAARKLEQEFIAGATNSSDDLVGSPLGLRAPRVAQRQVEHNTARQIGPPNRAASYCSKFGYRERRPW